MLGAVHMNSGSQAQQRAAACKWFPTAWRSRGIGKVDAGAPEGRYLSLHGLMALLCKLHCKVHYVGLGRAHGCTARIHMNTMALWSETCSKLHVLSGDPT